MKSELKAFDHGVFINCPFDPGYLPLLRPLIFCILDLGFEPRIALERFNSGEVRLEKIIALIEQSRFGIHDFSRLRATAAGEFYRLNMPFELGLDFACYRFRGPPFDTKQILILEEHGRQFPAALSDLAGMDVKNHGGDANRIVTVVRAWLQQAGGLRASGPSLLFDRFIEFTTYSYEALVNRGFSGGDIEQIEIGELIGEMREWIARNPISPAVER